MRPRKLLKPPGWPARIGLRQDVHTLSFPHMTRTLKASIAAVVALAAMPHFASGQSLDLTVNDVGISIGDSRRVTGLRINYRDLRMEEVVGVNITAWLPYERNRGRVRGVALGIPATGAANIDGIALGIVGTGVHETMRGISIGGIGAGIGTDMSGISLGGIGMGIGNDMTGLGIGGIGMGIGQDLKGIGIGGIGMGIGRDARGLAIGGIGAGVGRDLEGIGIAGLGFGIGEDATGVIVAGVGAGVGGNLKGLSVAGIGFGAGGNVNGITIAGIGLGAGGNVTGLTIAGAGIGAGGTLKYVSLAVGGIGASRIEGLAAATAVGAEHARGVVIAPAYFRIANGGEMRGVNLSAYNNVRGIQRGLAIGIFNYARTLDGVQLGLLNYARNKPKGTRLLPIVNYARGR